MAEETLPLYGPWEEQKLLAPRLEVYSIFELVVSTQQPAGEILLLPYELMP